MAAQPHPRRGECADRCVKAPSYRLATRCASTNHCHLFECPPQHTRGPPASGAGVRERRPVERRYVGLVAPAVSQRRRESAIAFYISDSLSGRHRSSCLRPKVHKPLALSVRGVFVVLGWSERAPPPTISVFQGIDFFEVGDPRHNVLYAAVTRS